MSDAKKVVIFGATGGTGKQLVSQALELGYQVTAFVRDPDKLEIKDENLIVITGDVLKKTDVDKAVTAQDAVFSALGVRPGNQPICTRGIKTIIASMKKKKVNRLIVVSAYGVRDTKQNFYPKLLWLLLKSLMQDKEDMEEALESSHLNWTAVRPTILTSGPQTSSYQPGKDLNVGFMPKISRADVADFMLNAFRDNSHINEFPTITSL